MALFPQIPFTLRNIFNSCLFVYWKPHSLLRNAININLIVDFLKPFPGG